MSRCYNRKGVDVWCCFLNQNRQFKRTQSSDLIHVCLFLSFMYVHTFLLSAILCMNQRKSTGINLNGRKTEGKSLFHLCYTETTNSEQEHAVCADDCILRLYRCEESVSDDHGRLLRTAELPLDYP